MAWPKTVFDKKNTTDVELFNYLNKTSRENRREKRFQKTFFLILQLKAN